MTTKISKFRYPNNKCFTKQHQFSFRRSDLDGVRWGWKRKVCYIIDEHGLKLQNEVLDRSGPDFWRGERREIVVEDSRRVETITMTRTGSNCSPSALIGLSL